VGVRHYQHYDSGHVILHGKDKNGRQRFKCRGCATKYLTDCLGWNRAMMRDGFAGEALPDRALA
jgi:hypothetical protein